MKKKNVLVLCTGNSCRSQMAEGFLKSEFPDSVIAYSAGTNPHGLNPYAVRVMKEADVDISTHTSNHLDEYKDIAFDIVLTVCDNANEVCPVFPSATNVIHHSFDDPPALAKNASSEEEAINHYRRVRDEIKEFISTLDEFSAK